MKKRFIKHYLPFLTMILMVMLIFFIFRGKRDNITYIAQSTGYISLVLLALSLMIGPVNLILKHKNPVSTYFRRDFGITAGVLALIHSVTGLFVHLRGRMWLYFLNEDHHIRLDNFGLANYTGVISALLIILLIMTSNDHLLRNLGSGRWKNIQRLAYLMILLTAAHCYFYTIGKDNRSIFFWFYIPLFLIVLILQFIGIHQHLFNHRGHNEGFSL